MSSSLQIELDNPQPYYCFGDVLSGRVMLETFTDRAIGSTTINLFGRAKTKVIRDPHGQSRRVYRGRANFFDIPQVLYQGHHTHKAGTFSWTFSFTIPEHPLIVQEGDKWSRSQGFLSSEDDTFDHTLPSTFAYRHRGFTKRWQAYVEYYLKVVIIVPPGDRGLFSSGTIGEKILRLRLQNSMSASPLTDFQLRTSRCRHSITTLRLLPEHADANLTFKQRAKSFFNSSSVPGFTFQMHVTFPTVIQLNHSGYVPFFIEIEPDQYLSNTAERKVEGPPHIYLSSFSIGIKSRTHARTRGPFALYDVDEKETKDIIVACRTNLRQVLSTERLDIGNMSKLTLRKPLFIPSFRTYNISHSHKLEFRIEVECAGEKECFDEKSGVDITILGPPEGDVEEDLGPPSDPPPSDDDDDDDGYFDGKGNGKGGKSAEAAREKRNFGGSSQHRNEEDEGQLPQYSP
jgi:hypothetical protein